MKKDRRLPTVFKLAEIFAILDAAPNLKQKAMIAAMYSGGLRVPEATHFPQGDLHTRIKQLHTLNKKYFDCRSAHK